MVIAPPPAAPGRGLATPAASKRGQLTITITEEMERQAQRVADERFRLNQERGSKDTDKDAEYLGALTEIAFRAWLHLHFPGKVKYNVLVADLPPEGADIEIDGITLDVKGCGLGKRYLSINNDQHQSHHTEWYVAVSFIEERTVCISAPFRHSVVDGWELRKKERQSGKISWYRSDDLATLSWPDTPEKWLAVLRHSQDEPQKTLPRRASAETPLATSTDDTDHVHQFLSRLGNCKQQGDGWTARCPAHDDNHASLSVGLGEDRRILVKCHAGCSFEDIVSAVGLPPSALFPPKKSNHKPIKPEIVATYSYCDENGTLLFQKVRYPKGGKQRFSQRQPDGQGDWIWHLQGVRQVLYRLPELLAAIKRGETIYVAEGEKDVNNLWQRGVAATCNPGGAGKDKWRGEFSEMLRGAKVIILPDNDDVGREHADQVGASLVGVAASVQVLAIPNLPEKGDVSDFFESGGTADALREMAAKSPEWKPERQAREDMEGVLPAIASLLEGRPIQIMPEGAAVVSENATDQEKLSALLAMWNFGNQSRVDVRFIQGDIYNALPDGYGERKRLIGAAFRTESENIYNQFRECGWVAGQWPRHLRRKGYSWDFWKQSSAKCFNQAERMFYLDNHISAAKIKKDKDERKSTTTTGTLEELPERFHEYMLVLIQKHGEEEAERILQRLVEDADEELCSDSLQSLGDADAPPEFCEDDYDSTYSPTTYYMISLQSSDAGLPLPGTEGDASDHRAQDDREVREKVADGVRRLLAQIGQAATARAQMPPQQDFDADLVQEATRYVQRQESARQAMVDVSATRDQATLAPPTADADADPLVCLEEHGEVDESSLSEQREAAHEQDIADETGFALAVRSNECIRCRESAAVAPPQLPLYCQPCYAKGTSERWVQSGEAWQLTASQMSAAN